MQRIYEGVPAISLVGPTGSGKSALARYVGAQLVPKGWETYVVDASARLGGDRLFERDDFDPSGTFLLEGFLIGLRKKLRQMLETRAIARTAVSVKRAHRYRVGFRAVGYADSSQARRPED